MFPSNAIMSSNNRNLQSPKVRCRLTHRSIYIPISSPSPTSTFHYPGVIISGTNLLYRWKREQLAESGPVAGALEVRVHELEIELRRVERERDILKKALAIFGRNE